MSTALVSAHVQRLRRRKSRSVDLHSGAVHDRVMRVRFSRRMSDPLCAEDWCASIALSKIKM
eukprot:3960773-Alexandrium_andersonii.AAC.1